MTFNIYYNPVGTINRYSLFDIEYYLRFVYGPEGVQSEIHCLPMVKGLTYFLKDKFEDKDFDCEEFIKDAEEIQEIRGFLFEKNNNRPKNRNDASYLHKKVFLPKIEDMISKFVEKYNLGVDRD